MALSANRARCAQLTASVFYYGYYDVHVHMMQKNSFFNLKGLFII